MCLEAPYPPIGPIRFHKVLAKSLEFDWQSPKEDGGRPIKSYRLEYNESDTKWEKLASVKANVSKYKADDLTTGKHYKFRVSAINDIGSSKPLDSDSVVPTRPPGMDIMSNIDTDIQIFFLYPE